MTFLYTLKSIHSLSGAYSQVKSSHLYLYSAFNNTDCVKALNSIKLEDRVSVMYNNKIKHSIFSSYKPRSDCQPKSDFVHIRMESDLNN